MTRRSYPDTGINVRGKLMSFRTLSRNTMIGECDRLGLVHPFDTPDSRAPPFDPLLGIGNDIVPENAANVITAVGTTAEEAATVTIDTTVNDVLIAIEVLVKGESSP
jgi:hypothetical protein